jgi:hypothetical protein
MIHMINRAAIFHLNAFDNDLSLIEFWNSVTAVDPVNATLNWWYAYEYALTSRIHFSIEFIWQLERESSPFVGLFDFLPNRDVTAPPLVSVPAPAPHMFSPGRSASVSTCISTSTSTNTSNLITLTSRDIYTVGITVSISPRGTNVTSEIPLRIHESSTNSPVIYEPYLSKFPASFLACGPGYERYAFSVPFRL